MYGIKRMLQDKELTFFGKKFKYNDIFFKNNREVDEINEFKEGFDYFVIYFLFLGFCCL